MEQPRERCPECGANIQDGTTCEDAFHQLLSWESEDTHRGIVHHLMVLAYHLQHPSLYSPEGLLYSIQLLASFVEEGISPQQVRLEKRAMLSSNRRSWKIRSRPGNQASYKHPMRWSMTAHDVVHAGAEQYVESVSDWARWVLADLRATNNLP